MTDEQKNRKDAERLARMVSRFAIAASAHRKSLEEMDEAGAAAHAKILIGLYASICREGERGMEAFLALLDDDDDSVAGMAAVFALEGFPGPALAVLRRLASGDGLLGFRARHVLDIWERGEWRQP